MGDVRAAFRLLVSRPGLCAAVVLTLTIGFGSATAIFSLAYALLVRPLPFPDADRIVAVEALIGNARGRLALREVRDLERDTRAFSRWGAYYRSQYNLTGGGPPEALTCTIAASSMFGVLGIRPALGDIWPAAEDFTRQYRVLLSHRLWQQRFGGRPDVIGQPIVMDGGTYRIDGVLPDGVDFPLQTDVFRSVTDYNAPQVRRYSAIARLADGRTLNDAQADLDAMSTRFAEAWPETNRGVRLVATPLRDAYVGGARPFLLLLVAGVGALVLIACVNVANLLLSRALAQRGDFAIRLALGAPRRRLVVQSTTEALLLASIGGVLGLAASRYAIAGLTRIVASDLPPWLSIDIDGIVLVASALLVVGVSAATGVLPALQASRTNIEEVLRQDSGRSAGSHGQQVSRRWLVGAQAALASLLLVAAGVFAMNLTRLLSVPTGFDTAGVLTFRVDPPYSRYGDIHSTSEFYRRAGESLQSIPGVEAVGTNSNLPFARLDVPSPRVVVEGRQAGRADEEPFVNLQVVDGGYFPAMRLPIVRGRVFTLTDDERSMPVGVISERAARRFFGDAEALGRRIRVTWNQSGTGTAGGSEVWLTIVGIVGAVRFDGVDDDDGLDVYAPNTQLFAGDAHFVVRGHAAGTLMSQIRGAIDRVDREQSYFDVRTMRQRVDATLWQHRVSTLVLLLLAAIAVVLAAVGTYAVTAHAVAAQRRDVAIRLALGSSNAAIGWLVARSWVTAVAVGISVGMLAGLLVARALAGMLGASVSIAGWPFALPAMLMLAAGAACYLPVRRLLRRVALIEALRGD